MGCSPWGRKELDTTERLHFHFPLSCIGEGNGNPLHCSCLENPRDSRVWWAAVYGVTQSRTWLKWLSSSSSSRKTDSCKPWGRTQLLRWPTCCGGCFSLNKSTSHLSFCLSPNSFCDKISTIWASWGPKTRCVISVNRSLVQVPTWILVGFKSPQSPVSQVLLTINLSVYILPSFQHTHILLHLFFWGVLKQVVKLPICAQSQTAMEVVLKPRNSGWDLEESGTQREQTSNSVHVLCKTLQDSDFHQRRSQRH